MEFVCCDQSYRKILIDMLAHLTSPVIVRAAIFTPSYHNNILFLQDFDKNNYDPSSANAYIVCYSCTDKDSFVEAQALLKNLRHFEKSKAIILCGNKSDLARKRQVSTEGKLREQCVLPCCRIKLHFLSLITWDPDGVLIIG